MTDALKGIERARALAQLLQAKAQSLTANGIEKAKLIKTILDLRDRLGMTEQNTDWRQPVLDRIAKNPVDPTTTLTAEEYSLQVQSWLPSSVIGLTDLETKNAKGAAIAISSVLNRYPMLAKGSYLRFFATARSVMRLRKEREKNAEKLIDTVFDEFTKTDEYPQLAKVYEAKFDQIVDGAKAVVSWRFTQKRKIFAESLGVQKDKEVKRLASSGADLDNDFVATCKRAYVRRRIRDSVASNIKTSHPEAMKNDIPKFSGAMAKGVYASYYYGYGIILSDRFKENLKDSVDEDTAAQFHPQGTVSDAPEDAAKSIVAHELGHALDHLLDLRHNSEIVAIWSQHGKKRIAEEISKYASTNIREMIAEAFCEYHTSANPRPLAKTIGEIIDVAYDSTFGGKV